MQRLLSDAGQARPFVLYPLVLILGFLVAYAWWLALVWLVLPLVARVVGAD